MVEVHGITCLKQGALEMVEICFLSRLRRFDRRYVGARVVMLVDQGSKRKERLGSIVQVRAAHIVFEGIESTLS